MVFILSLFSYVYLFYFLCLFFICLFYVYFNCLFFIFSVVPAVGAGEGDGGGLGGPGPPQPPRLRDAGGGTDVEPQHGVGGRQVCE